MTELYFLITLSLLVLLPSFWGIRHLPKERWQMLAAIPTTRDTAGWKATNLTFYGFFSATAYAFSTGLYLLLMGTCGIPPMQVLAITIPVLGLCIPASRWIARIVEKKPHTFTVGGAVFFGILITPWILMGANLLAPRFGLAPIPVLCAMAALAIAYAFGEGIGRLACLSFGCCYGKPVRNLSPALAPLLTPMAQIFSGETKKIAYAAGLAEEPVVPVQAMTLVICCLTGLVSTMFFLSGNMKTAFLLSLCVTQFWRVLSEFLRADYRGEQRFSAYQIMALCGIPYAVFFTFFFGSEDPLLPHLATGLAGLWNPGILLFLQILWLITFFYTGKSEVTGASLHFHVKCDRI